MASFFRRKRSLIFKLVIGIPAIWFFVVIFLSYSQDKSDSHSNKEKFVIKGNGDGSKVVHQESEYQKKVREAGVVAGKEWEANHLPPRNPIMNDINNRDSQEGQKPKESENVHFNHINDDNNNKEDDDDDESLKFEPAPPDAPGEMGRAVIIDKEKLSSEDRKKYDEGWNNNAFNQYASDMISLHRTLQDVRDPECKSLQYRQQLPDTSVVICFHNEALSVLLRTVHSVLDRSPKRLIREIILVDDYSDKDHLMQPLDDYVAKMKKVKVVRTKQREGLIRARLVGFAVAVGDVVTFLDSHCECAEGWLEPLVERIAQNKSTVVCPVIDVIEDDSFKYQFGNARSTSIGGFDWNMQFNWHAIPDYERERRKNLDYLPVRTPTMAGGLFSIDREYFKHLGTYDPGMDIWGGENLELSFRVWMCGGTLEIIPCSHVGHIFRKRSPYKWRTGVNVVKKNSIRLAEVWMDEYKNYYYERFNHDLGDFGDITERKQLRKNLNCKSFDWFVKNIYPDLFVPGEAMASGEVRNKAKSMCVDSAVDHVNYHKPVNMWPCHNQGGNQYWMLSKHGEIRRDDGCLDFSGGDSVIIYPCHGQKGNQEWKYQEDNTVLHVNTNKCMEMSVDGQKLLMRPCTGVDRQLWQWKRKSPTGIIRDDV